MLVVKAITKTFGRTRALAGADFELREREIHGLVGVSGAGKSTLAAIIAGHRRFDDGEMTYRSYAVRLNNPREALRVGIAIVTQEACLVPDLSVVDNIVLPQFGRPGRLDEAALRHQALALLASFGQADALPLDREVRRLSAAQRQIVEVARALGLRAKVILFDEPTAALSRGDADRLFDIMARLRRAGCAVVFASRELEEVIPIADRITVLREGRTVINACPAAEADGALLHAAMTGPATGGALLPTIKAIVPLPGANLPPPLLAVRGLAAAPAVRDVSFDLRAGEILGLGGLVGAGRTATLDAIFGLRARSGGTVLLGGAPLPSDDPAAAIRAGMACLPAARRGLNLVPDLSALDNLRLAQPGSARGSAGGAAALDAVLDRVGLRWPDVRAAHMLDLPAGTQRRLALARALLGNPKVLLLDEPTRGLDPAARGEMLAILRDVAARGTALLFAAEAEDLLALADRIVVIRAGCSAADVPRAMLDEDRLALLAAPPAAMQRKAALLRALTHDNGGASFWALIDDDNLICLDAVVDDPKADPGFAAGESHPLAETAIPEALRRRATGFVREAGGARATMLVPIRTARGHALGWVGLSLAGAGGLPPAAAVLHRIEALAAAL